MQRFYPHNTTEYLSFGPIEENIMFFCDLSGREKDWRSHTWSEGDVSAEHCLQCEADELAEAK